MDDSVEFLVLTPIVKEVSFVLRDSLRPPLPTEKDDSSPYVVVSAPPVTPMVLVPEVPTLVVIVPILVENPIVFVLPTPIVVVSPRLPDVVDPPLLYISIVDVVSVSLSEPRVVPDLGWPMVIDSSPPPIDIEALDLPLALCAESLCP